MITLIQLKEYAKYGGDIDGWARMTINEPNKVLTAEERSLIAGLIQDLFFSNNELASHEYLLNLNKKLTDTFDNDESIEYLKSLAK